MLSMYWYRDLKKIIKGAKVQNSTALQVEYTHGEYREPRLFCGRKKSNLGKLSFHWRLLMFLDCVGLYFLHSPRIIRIIDSQRRHCYIFGLFGQPPIKLLKLLFATISPEWNLWWECDIFRLSHCCILGVYPIHLCLCSITTARMHWRYPIILRYYLSSF